jgi:hypothetical protein
MIQYTFHDDDDSARCSELPVLAGTGRPAPGHAVTVTTNQRQA